MTDIKKMNTGGALDRRGFLKAAAAAAAAPALAGLPGNAMAQEPVALTFWAWTPKTQNQVDLFMKKYPNIKVTLENVGQGGAHYTKVRNALKAGSGVPDVAQMEFQNIRSFRAIDALLDLSPYGANDQKSKFIDWTWAAVSDGNAVYAMPWDSGPMGILYRGDVYDKAGIKSPPATWDEFAETAMKVAKDSPGNFLANFGPNDAGWNTGLLWQAGWRPFKNNGTEITIDINSDAAKKWAAYWQKLLDAKAVDRSPAWTTEWFKSYDTGRYATWVTAAWGAVLLSQFTKESVGKWRAAGLPQWKAGETVTSNWGGSTFAAFKNTKYPKEAALFCAFMATDPEGSRKWNTEQYLFPVLKDLVADKALMGFKYDFYGGQAVNEVFVKSAAEVAPGFEFSPFHDYYAAQVNDALAAAVGGKGTLAEALDGLQKTIVAYAKDQGYTVKT